MPHFTAKKSHLILPFKEQDYYFDGLFTHTQYKEQKLILVTFKNYSFLIMKIPHKNGYLFKAHKATKPSPIGILKDALLILSKKCDTLTHNLSNNTLKQKILSPYFFQAQDFLIKTFSHYFLEIGFGSGRHILNLAQNNPTEMIIGVEIHTPSIQQVLRQIQLLGIQNLYITKLDARILTSILPSNSAKQIFLHFPIPWNKKPHRRILTKEFLFHALRILKPQSSLHLRTDDQQYFDDALALALENMQTSLKIHKNVVQNIISKYEARWLKQNKNIYDLYFYSLQENAMISATCDFNFTYYPNPQLQKQKIIERDFFIHINASYTNKNSIIISVSFGDFNWPITNFIIINHQTKQTYFLEQNLLPTQANIKAYQKLKILLGG